MAGLFAKESDGERGLKSERVGDAGIARDAGGHINGDDGRALVAPQSVDTTDEIARHTANVTRKARAEQGVDDEKRALARRRCQWLDRTTPTGCGDGCISLKGFTLTIKMDGDRPSHVAQQARRDETVTPIIAGAAKHIDGALRKARGTSIGNGTACVFHKDNAGRSAFNRHTIGACHFIGGEQNMGRVGHGATIARLHAGGSRKCTITFFDVMVTFKDRVRGSMIAVW
jgi:hypothetical protein